MELMEEASYSSQTEDRLGHFWLVLKGGAETMRKYESILKQILASTDVWAVRWMRNDIDETQRQKSSKY